MSDLLDRAIEAHGGLDRWHGVRAIDVVFNFSGGLLDLKGFPGHHRPAVSVDTLKPRAVLQRLHGDPDDRWKFFTPMPARVSIPVRRRVHRRSIGIPMTLVPRVPRPSSKPAFPLSVPAKLAGKPEEIAQAMVR
jgi:hypothetical protein